MPASLEDLIGVYDGTDSSVAYTDEHDHDLVLYQDEDKDGQLRFLYYHQTDNHHGTNQELFMEGTFSLSTQGRLILHSDAAHVWGQKNGHSFAEKRPAEQFEITLRPDSGKWGFTFNHAFFVWRNQDIDFALGWLTPIRVKAKMVL
jgi:hypothetical protein